MIRSKLAHRRVLAEGGPILVWLTSFKNHYVFTASGIGLSGKYGVELRQDTKASRRALQARFAGSNFHEVFVSDVPASVISVNRSLTSAGPRDGIFFLCNTEVVQAAVLAHLGAVIPSEVIALAANLSRGRG